MSVRIVFDHPGRQTRAHLTRVAAQTIGALLVVVGLTSTVVAIPTGLVAVADIVMHLQREQEPLFPPGFPLRETELAFAGALALSIVALRRGRRLVRGERRVVLFLRRFGYRGSMQVVTYAVAHTIGDAWRLVTLDDAEMAPLGVATASRVVFGAGERIARLAGAAGRGVFVAFQWSVGGFWLTVALQAAVVAPHWQRLLEHRTIDRYLAILTAVMEGRVPSAYFGFTLPGAFAIFATGIAVSLLGLLVVFVTMLALLPMLGFVMMASSSAEALRRAEASKTETITSQGDIDKVVDDIAERGRQTFAPRLVVLRVATSAWHQAVTTLGAETAASIIDISEPTENLAWELQELERLCPGRCIVVGEHARIARWGNTDLASTPGTALDARVAQMLDGHDILAYTTDAAGMRRFARALYGVLLDLARASANKPAAPTRAF